MNVHFFGTALLVSLVICVPLIVASAVALILRKRPLSWILYGAGAGISAGLLIACNIFQDAFKKTDVFKLLPTDMSKFTTMDQIKNSEEFIKAVQTYPNKLNAIKLYYFTSWSTTIALVMFLILAIALFLVLIVVMNKKRENYVRERLVSQYQTSFK